MSSTTVEPITGGTTTTTEVRHDVRRIGRVERWLRKGYGFIIDLGEVNATEKSYGWTRDEISNTKIFVYHNALVSQSDQVFHRLFAHEYVEYTIDTSRPTRDGRHQAFNVTGLQRQVLLCDLNTNNDEDDTPQPPQQPPRVNQRYQHTQHAHAQHAQTRRGAAAAFMPPPGATVVYYVPGVQPQVPQSAEPSYVMPMSGIPVPK